MFLDGNALNCLTIWHFMKEQGFHPSDFQVFKGSLRCQVHPLRWSEVGVDQDPVEVHS